MILPTEQEYTHILNELWKLADPDNDESWETPDEVFDELKKFVAFLVKENDELAPKAEAYDTLAGQIEIAYESLVNTRNNLK